MKKVVAILAMIFSTSAFSYSYDERNSLIQTCSYYSDVSESAIFGTPSEYGEKYPKLGLLSAKIDKVYRIKRETKIEIDAILVLAKKNKDAVQYGIFKNDRMTERTRDSITLSQHTADMASHYYKGDMQKLRKENEYVTEKAIKDVYRALKSDKRTYGKFGQYYTSSHQELLRCEEWWGK